YNKKNFETILEIKGREEHDKLLAMLDDLNNFQIPIDAIIEKYFDLDNFLTWTAINILMDNMDTDANNFYLYSPLNSEKWYLLPWDYDGGWELQRESFNIRTYQSGISNFWGSVLHNRYFRSEQHVQQLIEKIEEISKYINKETVTTQVGQYQEIVEPFLLREPDNKYLPGLNSDFKNELDQIVQTPNRSLERFFEDLEKPKPFYMWDVVYDSKNIKFKWDVSFDLQGDDLFYQVSISKDPAFQQIVFSKNDILENQLIIPMLNSGTYYWKVVVKDSEGHEQTSFDAYSDVDGFNYYGVREFEVR
ncbi:MAG: CotH kinase family protein, partial [Melioribacteraceae bacterium]|nr:CotH kinase family protein [Melioribacteraceae bacterium]